MANLGMDEKVAANNDVKKTIPPIKAEIDYLDKNEHEIYCIGDWVQKRIGDKMLPVSYTAVTREELNEEISEKMYKIRELILPNQNKNVFL